jgi:hypothetical protein
MCCHESWLLALNPAEEDPSKDTRHTGRKAAQRRGPASVRRRLSCRITVVHLRLQNMVKQELSVS